MAFQLTRKHIRAMRAPTPCASISIEKYPVVQSRRPLFRQKGRTLHVSPITRQRSSATRTREITRIAKHPLSAGRSIDDVSAKGTTISVSGLASYRNERLPSRFNINSIYCAKRAVKKFRNFHSLVNRGYMLQKEAMQSARFVFRPS